ncbi:mntR transcriptional regulator [Candidatus Endolissoclinum faulkneri L2]|uniref:Transcriptional regulator MntR n=2 Tax=Candidatus Endolissoclinum faulkneri TaxID=1263979 RepID=K7YPU7_9PROT|nr:mntR transcriptional regulator [Candidatus Endolissoclinum faulkneri L2]
MREDEMANDCIFQAIDNQAGTFKRLRDEHAREVTEDYVEMIANLIDQDGEARAVTLAERFGVTPATVNNTLKRLERDGYVTSKPYRAIFLTDNGRVLAKTCKERHQMVCNFLIAIGVDRDIAEADAEGIEHHVSEATISFFRDFVAKQIG